MQNLLSDLETSLSVDQSLFSDGKILKNAVIERALKVDVSLIKLLLKSPTIKDHFFQDVGGALVFDKVKFQEFVSNKQFLPDSFTAFKNKIGLTDGGSYLKENKDVVLAWAYKDCVLEGGMTKEDQGQDEIFYNTTLAPDDITRLFEPKVLTKFEKWDAEAVKKDKPLKVEAIAENDNLLIKGNNLLALHSLKTRYAGKVKLIYIDPPYNTGDDDFKYNDNFNHSSWLTFMKNRLQAAHDLLARDGSIFISIDNNELHYLWVLVDEIFGKENFAGCISVKRGSVTGHKAINAGVVNIAEYVLVFSKDKDSWKPNKVYKARDRNSRYDTFILNRDKDMSEWQFCSLLEAFSEHAGIAKNKVKKELGAKFEGEIYKFVKANAASVIQIAYPDESKVSKAAQEAIKKSRQEPETIYHLERENELDIYIKAGKRLLFYSDRLMEIDGELVTAETISDFWDDVLPNDLHNEGGVSLKKGKKPEKLIKRIYEIGSNEGDLVMDFFAGSGTSLAVAHKMKRQWIGTEQLEYIKNLPEQRLKNVVAGDKTGISKAVEWQGGGSFIYCELMEWNEGIVQRIRQAKTTKDLQSIYNDINGSSFLRYDVDMKEYETDDFTALELDDQKKALLACLEMNHLYVNIREIDDKEYGVSDEDKLLNKKFYGK